MSKKNRNPWPKANPLTEPRASASGEVKKSGTDLSAGPSIPDVSTAPIGPAVCPSDFLASLPISAAQLAANRANSQLSTGPRTDTGKARASLNAVKTALTGRTVLLPTDDVAEYEAHTRAYEEIYRPVGQLETDLVRSISDTTWRLLRIPSLENGIYAIGSIEFADQYEEHEPGVRGQLIQLAVHFKYERQIRNLQLQESRLTRRREKEIAELRALQKERKAQQEQEPAAVPTKTRPQPVEQDDLLTDGFDFSLVSPTAAALYAESKSGLQKAQEVLRSYGR